ncbi:methyltransferase [Actinokineospora fastidiosa]|uniref:Methyltransferase n=1 Tax=Actinokineospora fastidiosa TaxID=1816 RepID=A0A918G1N2_9PSEU|nr:methyltransferase [Actinokineospora fastidiosa]
MPGVAFPAAPGKIGGMDFSAMIRANEANWDARVPIHVASRFYAEEPSAWFAPHEWDDLGDLAGRDVVHLQCHIGSETRALAERGARVTGLDLSAASLEAARAVPGITYVHGDVLAAVDALGPERFDVVYTGKGSLVFVPDLPLWAEQVAGLLRPGRFLYLVEFHPVLYTLGLIPSDDETLTLRDDYLGDRGPIRVDGTYTYTDGPPLSEATEYYEWRHGLGEVITALLGAGLRLDLLRETPEIPWKRWEGMVNTVGPWHRLPDDAPRIPLMYALRAVKP